MVEQAAIRRQKLNLISLSSQTTFDNWFHGYIAGE